MDTSNDQINEMLEKFKSLTEEEQGKFLSELSGDIEKFNQILDETIKEAERMAVSQ